MREGERSFQLLELSLEGICSAETPLNCIGLCTRYNLCSSQAPGTISKALGKTLAPQLILRLEKEAESAGMGNQPHSCWEFLCLCSPSSVHGAGDDLWSLLLLPGGSQLPGSGIPQLG